MRTETGDSPWRESSEAGGRLPEDAHVGAVHLQISDLPRSLDYYEGVLGLVTLQRTAARASLGCGGAAPLLHLVERKGVTPVPRRGRFGLYHFAVLLPHRLALSHFAAHAFRLGLRPGMADHAVSEALYLNDPDGLGIEIYADRPRSAWAYRNGEVVMTTDPLDIADLLAVGEDGVWRGVPEGTTIGHVHLHVGELSSAETFYRRVLGFDITVSSYSGALFFSTGGYHHHLATNVWSPGPSAADDEAKLLDWELVVPDRRHTDAVAERMRAGGHEVNAMPDGLRASDPWGTRVHVRSGERR
jgi:catechol 2,3-dioxygenase